VALRTVFLTIIAMYVSPTQVNVTGDDVSTIVSIHRLHCSDRFPDECGLTQLALSTYSGRKPLQISGMFLEATCSFCHPDSSVKPSKKCRKQ